MRALNYLDTEIGAMVSRIREQGLARSTAIIVSAKHGQSPTDPNALARVPDAPIISAINAAWTAAHPGAGKPGEKLDQAAGQAATVPATMTVPLRTSK